jgi:hypothetical protein
MGVCVGGGGGGGAYTGPDRMTPPGPPPIHSHNDDDEDDEFLLSYNALILTVLRYHPTPTYLWWSLQFDSVRVCGCAGAAAVHSDEMVQSTSPPAVRTLRLCTVATVPLSNT